MSKNSTKQSGSMVAGIIAAVLIIGVVGFIGWRLVGQSTKKTNNATSSSQTTSKTPASSNQNTAPTKQTDPNAGYVVITEWGVRFKPVSGLDGLEYALRNSNNAAVFSTQQLTSADANCSTTATNYSGIGSITRTTAGSTAPFGGTLLATVNGHDYYYNGTQSTCITDASNKTAETLFENTTRNFYTSTKSLEAAQ